LLILCDHHKLRVEFTGDAAMSVRATGSNAPLHRREKKGLARRDMLVEKYINEGLSHEDATERANKEMRDNQSSDWRKG
jgi:hypothetical protein